MSRIDKAIPGIITVVVVVMIIGGVFLFNQREYKRGQCEGQHGVFLTSSEVCVKTDGVIPL